MFSGPSKGRLSNLLRESRDAQAEVSTKLSRQVLAALHELLRGLVLADTRGQGKVIELAQNEPQKLYEGLVTTLMRLVFILYAEDRSLLPVHHLVYQQHYSVGGLFIRLCSDEAAWPDTMDQRFGAWAQLLSLFRLIHGGGRHGDLTFVARGGTLFDPERFGFLEGRYQGQEEVLPLVPNSCVWKILKSLMVLDGERLSYRTLDVEQIGSVYEAIMGFSIELTTGKSIAIKSPKKNGAAVVVDLENLLELDGSKRTKVFREKTERKLSPKISKDLGSVTRVEDLIVVLKKVIDFNVTPDNVTPEIVPAQIPILQPTDERRRSGSHYTPRSLTAPIVSEALRPVLDRLGAKAKPEEILDIKVLDPATGSGAFLVEVCRQIAERLVKAWDEHRIQLENLSAGEDALLYARRLVVKRCLYGVDKNPMAIDLARLSLWLITLAPNRQFTFIDHALQHGDSLVGLNLSQIEGFHWDIGIKQGVQQTLEMPKTRVIVNEVINLRNQIRESGDQTTETEMSDILNKIDKYSRRVEQIAACLLSAFFSGNKPKERRRYRMQYVGLIYDKPYSELISDEHKGIEKFLTDNNLKKLDPQIIPFHWELKFPEIFNRENSGFDVIVGNPPFAGKDTLCMSHHKEYPEWLKQIHELSHGNADLAAHFFRRAFNLLRKKGTLGLIATNTIAQGDTRSTGLRWICNNGGHIYRAFSRCEWPGDAAVIVSVVHMAKGYYNGSKRLDGRVVENISAFLSHIGRNNNPAELNCNLNKSFQGHTIRGIGFTVDDSDNKNDPIPYSTMYDLIETNPHNRKVILPYIGGDEVSQSPTHNHRRHVVCFRDYPLRRDDLKFKWADANEAMRTVWMREGVVPIDYPFPVASDWPDLLEIVKNKVLSKRLNRSKKIKSGNDGVKRWWLFSGYRRRLVESIVGLERILLKSRIGRHFAFTFLPNGMMYADSLVVFPFASYAVFCALQSRPHEIWARFFGSSFKDDLRYTPEDVFENFPFPFDLINPPADDFLENSGKEYYNYRASVMVEKNEGLTTIYNRFHNKDENDSQIKRLRDLHTEMDKATLEAYGWTDIPLDCKFLMDYKIDNITKRRRQPYRYRWPNEVCDELLERLWSLNVKRAAEQLKT